MYAAGRLNTETMELRINGQAVQAWTNVGGRAQQGDFVAYNYSAQGSITPEQVEVAFTNDDGQRRDLRVDRVVIGGTTYQSEASDTYSTGTWRASDSCSEGYKQSEWLHCNGSLAYAQGTVRTAQRGTEGFLDATLSDKETVQLFPNPTQEVAHVRVPDQGAVSITVTDGQGRTLLRHTQPRGGAIKLPVAQLPPGVYLVRVQQANRSGVHKLILE